MRHEPFTEFYEREIRSVIGLAYTLCGSMADAEELAQNAFTDAFRSWDRVGGLDKPGAWVRRAVANRAVSRRRRLGRESIMTLRLGSRSATSVAPDEPELSESAQRFFEMLRSLPARQAQVAALHYGEDWSIDEIASTLGISAGTVKTCLHRARATLAANILDSAGVSRAGRATTTTTAVIGDER